MVLVVVTMNRVLSAAKFGDSAMFSRDGLYNRFHDVP